MGVDLQGKLRQALGSVKDHASIGKAMMHNLHHGGFSEIEIAVLRATGHENTPIHDKHIHEILFLVCNSPAASIPFLAERISRRLGKTRDLLVALKTLVLIHRLLRGGNRSFEKQLRGAHKSFNILPSDNLAQAAMSNILKESFQVYMTFCEGIATLVNMFFDLTRPARALASEILKRASQQSQQLHHLSVQNIGFFADERLTCFVEI